MMLKKRNFFKIHSWIGIKLSILFFIVCFSGTIATISHELDWLLTPGIRVKPTQEQVSKNLMRDNIKAEYPNGEITYWMKPGASYLADIVYVEEKGLRKYVFLNPYTGEVQGDAQITIQRYFRDLHYFLFIPFQVGHFIVLAFGFLLLVSLLTALVFYKNWYSKLFVLKTGKGSLVFFRSLHRSIGLWSIPFSLLFAITGIWYFIERSDIGGIRELIYFDRPIVERNEEEWKNLTLMVDYDRAVQIAKEEIPGLEVEKIGPPSRPGSPLYVYGKNEVPLVRSRANRVYIDPISYDVLAVLNANDLNFATWLNDIADPLHFGYWGGLITKLIWFLMGLGISSLVLSGIWIAVKRQSKQKEKKKVIGNWVYANYLITALMFFFMYHALIVRYRVEWNVLLAVTLSWVLVIALSYFIFVVKVKRSVSRSKKSLNSKNFSTIGEKP